MLEQYLIKKLTESAYQVVKGVAREAGAKLLATPKELDESIAYHVRSIENWSAEVKFTDLKRAKVTSDIFIDLDLFIYPRRIRIDRSEQIQTMPLNSIFGNDRLTHVILLGQPGAGKTTSLQHLCQLLLHDADFYPERFAFPLLIRCRELNAIAPAADSSPLIDKIAEILGLRIEISAETTTSATERKLLKQKLVMTVLDELNALLMIDGFDELSEPKRRDEFINELMQTALQLNRSTMIVTSRTGDFVYNIENTTQYEICPLSKDQISLFAERWLVDPQAASDFLGRVFASPFADTAIRPLTLAHLCAIYERIGKIPDKPKTIYRKIINLLLEEWDQQRTVKRVSRYGSFEIDRKFEFLCHLAYVLTTSLQKTVFKESDLKEAYRIIHRDYDLESNEAQHVVSELESHTGLLIQSGYEEYEFAHKSLQEYLSAEYLVKLPSIPADERILSRLPNELAIAVSVSSSPTDYLSELVFSRLATHALSEDFVKAFLSRLLLEKPDFSSDFRVVLALIMLYTVYIECNVLRSKRAEPDRSDTLAQEFESIIRLTTQANAMAIIRSNYETAYVHKSEDGDDLLFLRQKKQPDGLLLQLAHSFPKEIYVRSSFLGDHNGMRQNQNPKRSKD